MIELDYDYFIIYNEIIYVGNNYGWTLKLLGKG